MHYFLELGANVIITSRKEDTLISTKKELEEAKNDQSITLPINEEVIDYWELISK